MLPSLLMMAWGNLRRRKTQNLLIAITIAVAALLFATAGGALASLDKPFEAMFTQLNASHFIFIADRRVYNTDAIQAWWQSQPEVLGVTTYPAYLSLSERLFLRGEQLSVFVLLVERPAQPSGQDQVQFIAGARQDFPAHGEVWVPNALANEAGIQVGDELGIPAENGLKLLRVSAIIVDPHFSGSSVNPRRVWVAPDELSFLFAPQQLHAVLFGVRLNDPAANDRLWGAFSQAMGGAFSSALYINYPVFAATYLTFLQLAAGFLLVFSVLSLFIALFIIYTTIAGSILADYRQIGILKAVGFTPGNIVGVYVLQFVLLALIALPVGLGLSYFATQMLLGLVTQATGTAGGDLTFIVVVDLVTLGVFLVLITGTALGVGRQAGQVKAVEAIRFGEAATPPTRQAWLNLTTLPLPLPVALGLKALFTQKRRALVSGLTIGLTVFVLSFAWGASTFVQNLGSNLAFFGIDNADVLIRRSTRRTSLQYEQLYTALQADARVQHVIPGDGLEVVLPAVGDKPPQGVIASLFDGDLEVLGLTNLQGRHPVTNTEIALATNTAQSANKALSDTLEIYVYGQKTTFTVVGIYQSISNQGQGVRLQLGAVRAINPLFKPNLIYLQLQDETQKAEYIAAVESQFGAAVDAEDGTQFYRDQLQGITDTLAMAQWCAAALFLVVTFTAIFNATLMDIRENARNFGIYKTVGLTPLQLRLAVVAKAVVIGLVATVLSVLVSGYLGPLLISSSMSDLGARTMAASVDWVSGGFLTVFMPLFCGLAAWFPSGRILEINPRLLIVE